MSTFALLTELTTDSPDNITFLSERCVRRRLNRSECTECLHSCPAEALSLVDNQMRHDARKCTGCMLCSACCPNDAFEVKGYDLETHIQSLSPGENLVISCPRVTQIDPDELIVPCVGAFSPAHLLALCLKTSGRIIFNVSACDSCANRAAAEHFESQLTTLETYLHDLREADLILLKNTTETTPRPAAENRRSFLKEMKKGLVSAVGSRLPDLQNEPGDGQSRNRRVPRRVRLVRDLLNQLEEKKRDIVASLYLYQVQVKENCTLCPLCKGICPTGAIVIDRVDGIKSLSIDNTLCSGCGLCVTFCKNDALRLQHPEGLKELQGGINCEVRNFT